jgi:hypothetical protein
MSQGQSNDTEGQRGGKMLGSVLTTITRWVLDVLWHVSVSINECKPANVNRAYMKGE